MFIGREKELEMLRKQFSSKHRTAVLIYGKRRIGKSSLIREAAKTFDGIVVNHVCVKSSYDGNLALLTRSIMQALDLPSNMSFQTIFDLFDFIKKFDKNILLLIDEYSYFKESLKDNELDSYMQIIIDSLPSHIKLVLCGSYISMMKELMLESNPLFGRFTFIQKLDEFDYLDSARFSSNLNEREHIKFYSVFGGSPYVLSLLDYDKSVEDNIEALLIEQNSILRTYIENVIMREINKAYDVRVLATLANGKKRYKEIADAINDNGSGNLDKMLKNLLDMDIIKKTSPINRQNDKKKQFYEICDNLMRFYFAYIFSNDTLISRFGTKTFFEKTINPSLNTFISFRFEDIVLQFFKRLAIQGKLKNVEDYGSYWYDDKQKGTNGQFDCVIKTTSGYSLFEVKFYSKPMDLDECLQEFSQINKIPDLNINKIGFISSAGFNFSNSDFILINGKDIYFNNSCIKSFDEDK